MAGRTLDMIFDSLITQRGKGARVYRRLTVNKERNWLLALTLNTFAKLGQSQQEVPFTDVEQLIVDAYRKAGFSDTELRQHGRFYERLPSATRAALFPGTFAQLSPRMSYALSNLQRDAPGIVQATLGMRNVTTLDVSAIEAGKAETIDFPLPRRDILREHGSGMLVVLGSEAPESAALGPENFLIKATKFKCVDEQGWDWWGSDEPYWIFVSVGSNTTVTTQTRTFTDVDSGESRTFNADEGGIWGPHGTPQPVPNGEIGAMIQLMEHDLGNTTAIAAGVGAAAATASTILATLGFTAWVAAITAAVGGILTYFLYLFGDDPIAENSLVFTRGGLKQMLPQAGKSINLTRRFTDGDADYSLKYTVSRVS